MAAENVRSMRNMYRYTLNRMHVPAIPIADAVSRGSVVVNMPPAAAARASAVQLQQARMQTTSSSSDCDDYDSSMTDDDSHASGPRARAVGSPNTDSTRAKNMNSGSHSDSSRGGGQGGGAPSQGGASSRKGTPARPQNDGPISDDEAAPGTTPKKPQRMLYSTLAPEIDGNIQQFMGMEQVSSVLQLSHRDQMHALVRTIELRGAAAGGLVNSEMNKYLMKGMLDYEKAISKMTNSRPPFVVRIFCRVALFTTLLLTSLLCVAHLAHNVYLAIGVLCMVTLVFFGLLEVCEEVEYMGLNLTPFFRELQCSEGIIASSAPPPPPMGLMPPPGMMRASQMPPPQMMEGGGKKMTGISEEEARAEGGVDEKADSEEGGAVTDPAAPGRMTQYDLRRSNLHYRDNIRP